MVPDIRDPTEDTGTVVGDTVQETQRDSTTGTARYLVVYEVFTLVEETIITAEAKVREGAMIQTPTFPPPRRADNSGRRSKLLGRR